MSNDALTNPQRTDTVWWCEVMNEHLSRPAVWYPGAAWAASQMARNNRLDVQTPDPRPWEAECSIRGPIDTSGCSMSAILIDIYGQKCK